MKKLDIWLCLHLPGPLRTFWRRLWIRKDEFHPSLDRDVRYESCLNRGERQTNLLNLVRRRGIAHKRT
jgi:hypothetical protein